MKQEINNQTVKKTLLQLAEFYNVKGLSGLALFLGIPKTTIYGWVRNGSISDTGVILAKSPEINREWLKTGQGDPSNLATIVQSPGAQQAVAKDSAKATITISGNMRGGKTEEESLNLSEKEVEFIKVFRLCGKREDLQRWIDEMISGKYGRTLRATTNID